MFDWVLRDVALPEAAASGRRRADVAVRGDRIAAIAPELPHDLPHPQGAGRGPREIAGRGRLLLPGLIDNHVHYREPGASWKEGYVTGTAASLRGGATTVGEIQNNRPLVETAAQWRAKVASIGRRARTRVLVYGCALRRNVAELRELARVAPAVKLFLAGDEELEVSDEPTLRAIFAEVAAVDGLLVVHAEEGPLVRAGLARFGARAEDFWRARSIDAEQVAVEKCIDLCRATGARIHFFHVSTAAACRALAAAKRAGLPVSGAACAHYLMFTHEDVGRRGALLKCNPSIKTAEDRAALRAAVADGTLDVIQSDHAPHPRAEKEAPFPAAPSGIPGADLLLPLWMRLVEERVLTLAQLVERACLGPARLHRLDDRGRLEVGALADLVLVDAEERTVREEEFSSRAKLSPYTGMQLGHWPALVWVGGELRFDRSRPESMQELEERELAAPPLPSFDGAPPGCC